MKKNISINIFGTIYAIDEDAYNLLENYLQSMKNYFKAQDGGDEIADDIEHRVAELLWQYREQGMEAVSIETVKEIIDKIGNAAEISDEAAAKTEQAEEEPETHEAADEPRGRWSALRDHVVNHLREHRLYRNTQDKLLGGVCSGLAGYFGKGDVVFWRLGTVALALILGSLHYRFLPDFLNIAIPALYIMLWIIVPPATTPEDKLRMKGRKVTPENLKEQIVSDSEEQTAAAVQPAPRRSMGCLRLIFASALALLALPLVALLVCLVFMLVLVLSVVIGGSATLLPMSNSSAQQFVESVSTGGPLLVVGLMAATVFLGITLWAIWHFVRTSREPLPSSVVFTSLAIWVVTLAITIFAAIFVSLRIDAYWDEVRKVEATRNGISLDNDYQWRCLDELGWSLTRLDNVEGYVTESRTGYAGLPPYALRIIRDDSTKPMDFCLVRSMHYEQGDYVLESLTETYGQGAVITVAKPGADADPLAVIDPASEGVRLQSLTWEEGTQLPILSQPDSAEWHKFAEDGRQHFSYHVSRPFHHDGGELTITIAANQSYQNRLYVRQVQLRKVEPLRAVGAKNKEQ